MAGTTRTITTSLKLDGEREFKSQMSSVNSELKTLKSDMALATAEFKGNANSVEALSAKDKILNQQLEQQHEKTKALEQAVKDAADAYGETDKRTDAYRQQLNNAKTAEIELNDKIQQNSKYLDEAKSSTTGCASSIDEYGNKIEDAGQKSMTAGDLIKANLTSQAIIAGVKALANAAKECAQKFGETISAAAEAGDAIDKESQKLQVSSDEYQELSFAAERCGTSMDTLGTANKTLQGTDFDGNLKDAILSVASITDENERAARATELFGKKAGQEMLPLLNSGADGVTALCQQVHDLGGVMSADAVSAAATYQDSLTNLQTAFGGLKNNLAGDFLPSVTTVMDGMTMIMSGDVDAGIAAIEEGITQFGEQVQQLGPYAEQALQLIVTVISENLPHIVECAGKVIVSLIDGLCQALPDLIPTVVDIVLTIVDVLVDNIDLLINAAIKLAVGLATGLIKAIPKIVERLPEIISAIVKGFVAAIPQLQEAGKQLVQGLWEGIKNMGAWIGQKIQGFGKGVVDSLKSFFGIHSPSTVMRDQIGKYLAEGVTDGFVDNIDPDAMADAIPSNFDIATNLNLSSTSKAKSGQGGADSPNTGGSGGVDGETIKIIVQSVLDGKVIGESVTNYQKRVAKAVGA